MGQFPQASGTKKKANQPLTYAATSAGNVADFVQLIRERLHRGEKFSTRLEYEKIAATQFGIHNRAEAKEYVELAIVQVCRQLALLQDGRSEEQRLRDIVRFYEQVQPNMSFLNSEAKMFHQYSTPTPFGFMAGVFTRVAQAEKVFEPSAGNGMLLVGAHPETCYVNELSEHRLRTLQMQFAPERITKLDAEKRFEHYQRMFDVVHTNPPFRPLKKEYDFNGWVFRALEHVMCAVALDTLKDTGRAAMIIGQHTEANEDNQIKTSRYFFNWLYHHYHVADVINLQGKLYSKQGTTFPIRMILISGRKQRPFGAAPVGAELLPLLQEETDFMQIYERIKVAAAWIPEEAPEPTQNEAAPVVDPILQLEQELLADAERFYALRTLPRGLKLALAARFSAEAGVDVPPTDAALSHYLQQKALTIQHRPGAEQEKGNSEPERGVIPAPNDLQNLLNKADADSWSEGANNNGPATAFPVPTVPTPIQVLIQQLKIELQ